MPESISGRRAIALGYRQGYAKGMQKGVRKGLQKGINEGRKRGVVDGMRKVILRQIRQRFGPPPVTLERRLESIAEARTLERIAGGLLKAGDLRQFKQLVTHGSFRPKRNSQKLRALPEGPARAVDWRRPRRQAPVRYPH